MTFLETNVLDRHGRCFEAGRGCGHQLRCRVHSSLGYAPVIVLKYMENSETDVEIVAYSTIYLDPYTAGHTLVVLQLTWSKLSKDIT